MTLRPKFPLQDFTFEELLTTQGLNRLDNAFLSALKAKNPILHDNLLAYRSKESRLNAIETSEFLIVCAQLLEEFLAELFHIEDALALSQAHTISFNPIAAFKKYFVLRRAKKEINKVAAFPAFAELNDWLNDELKKLPLQTDDKELAIALLAKQYLAIPDDFSAEIEKLVQWCTRILTSPEGKKYTAGWSSFQLPEHLNYANLVPTIPLPHDQFARRTAPDTALRLRDGFKLTDERMNAREVQNEVNYCIYCHDHEGDFCSKGFPVKKGDPDQGFKVNPLGITLTGCPLEEKISEMQMLKRDGHTLAALAMVMIDNPMCPATGHRICNDCMKSCIYQKQEPVNIPQIETRVLTDVLQLPWGVEIYDLLTRWHPLRENQWVMKPYNGLKIIVAGMGPAGFTLAHHLLLEGFAVVGFDGLKIEPLPPSLINEPVYRYTDLKESLDERLMAGFGGVAEYGITVRWDKNFLKLIYLSLMRRPYFQVFGGIRFGGTLTIEDAWEMGFHHFVVAVGAGLPKALPIPGSLAQGMRQANDFLMALQLGNAAKANSLTNLQIRLPAVVIGGGLTGVDTATELQAYYITQVEKILLRYETLLAKHGESDLRNHFDLVSRDILDEYLRHGLLVRKERERAKALNQAPNFIQLLREWGGVTIAYRRSMQESPAYINNHEELRKALEEGIYYAEGLEPAAVELDSEQHVTALICYKRIRNENKEWMTSQEEVKLPAHSILVATGTQPNTAYEFEHRGTFNRLNLQYQHYEEREHELHVAHGVKHCKDPQFGPFTSYNKLDRRVSLIGDTHPVFHGNVVKAIASGMRTYPKILEVLQDQLGKTGELSEYNEFKKHMNALFKAQVKNIARKTKDIIELTVQAPLAVKHFKPGQFYRLQNFETLALHLPHTLCQMEPLALVAAEHDKAQQTLTFIIHETNAASKLCATLAPGEAISLMGPTGVRAKMSHERETILIMGDHSSFAFLRSYGPSMRAKENRIIYFGVFEHKEKIYCQTKLEEATDMIIWYTREGENVTPNRYQDIVLTGDDPIIALTHYLQNHTLSLSLTDTDRIYLTGQVDLLRRFQAARNFELKPLLIKNPKVYGSVYGNMQCMLKGVCAQCMQWQIDPETGQRTKTVFACSWQDQPLEIIDLDHLEARQEQNRLADQLNHLWIDYVFKEYGISKV